jgi:hypothetical protein
VTDLSHPACPVAPTGEIRLDLWVRRKRSLPFSPGPTDAASLSEAQAALDSRAGDPERLDADDDGIACETHFGEPTSTATPRTTTPAPRTTAAPSNETDSGESDSSSGQVRTLPRGGVDTGDGSTVGDPVTAPALLALAGLGAVATTAAASTWRGRRSN